MPTAEYNYNTPALAANISGNRTLYSLDGSISTTTITTGGSVSALSDGCTTTGTGVPRTSGRNVYDVMLTSGPAPCDCPGLVTRGVALYTPIIGTSLNQLLVAAVSADPTLGAMVVGSR